MNQFSNIHVPWKQLTQEQKDELTRRAQLAREFVDVAGTPDWPEFADSITPSPDRVADDSPDNPQ